MTLQWSAPLGTTALSFLILGGLVVADRPVSEKTGMGLAVALGLLHGQMSGVEMQLAGIGLVGILGTVGTLFAMVSLVTGLVVSLERPWTRIAVRVAGSWIVAVGLLYVGWTFGAGR
jgi:hydrogenase/urease accessory protein HupE